MASTADRSLTHKTLIVVGVVLGTLALVGLVVFAFDVVLLAFAGVLLAVLLDGLAGLVHEKTGLPRGWALALIVLVVVGLLVGLVLLAGPRVAEQAGELRGGFAGALDGLLQRARQVPWLAPLIEQLPASGGSAAPAIRGAMGRLTGAFSAAFGVLANVVVVVFTGLYLAASPRLYVKGALRLFPRHRRERAGEVMGKLGHALRMWLLGQFVSMTLIGTLATVGLIVLGVPLALVVGLIVFVLAFIPYLGALLAAVPMLLAGMMKGPQTALAVAGLYVAIQALESYLITPLVQKRVVELAPAVLLLAELLLGVLAGVLGIALAAPLAVAVIVMVQTFYVEDVLGDTVDVLGEGNGG